MMFREEVVIPEQLPRDFDLLFRLIRDLKEEREAFKRCIETLEHKLQQVLRQLCGPRSERLHPNQMALLFDALLSFATPEPVEPQTPPTDRPTETKPKTRKGHGRRRLPKDLPRRRIVHDQDCTCEICGKSKIIIGEVVTEKYGYEPAQFFVIEEVRTKRACRDCEEGVVTAPKPPEAIPKCLAHPSLLAQVLTSKYADHLPLYRQQQIYKRGGLELTRSTLCGWITRCAEAFTPVVDFMTEQILESLVIHTDDTAVPVLDRQLEATRRGRLWVYIGDADHPHVVFDYTPTRERDGPADFLQSFTGYLQADAYAGYDGIYAGGQVQEVACWAHGRRKFYDLQEKHPAGPRLTALAFVRQLYQIEELSGAMDPEQRRQFRQKHARPVLRAFKSWLDRRLEQIRPKSPEAQAIGYVMRQWDALNRYTEHGALSIDNNLAERTLRPVAMGRKNWLFAGSDEGAKRAAVIFSLVASCRLHGLDPYAYFRFLLEQLPLQPADQIGDLTPLARVQAQPGQRLAA
jgi:transposase